ncbi:MAG TPA: alpha/beta fold hydrolase [Solirubrobacteraceae bacterium]|nr:alpha/beta fold hydrolase [Solirubrobacteraceae bacterium]
MDHRPEISPSLYRAGQGEPLVILHGFMSAWHQWRPVLADLVPYFEVIAPTLPGHLGGPAYEEDENTLAAAGDAMERHLDELGVGRAHLVGNSMGGALVLELAKRGRALSVVAIAPGGGWAPDSGEADRLARLFARQRRLARVFGPIVPAVIKSASVRRLAMRDVMRHGELVPPADVVQMMQASLHCPIFPRVIDALRSDHARVTDLEQISAPTLIAWPRHDRMLPMARHAARFRAEIPAVEFRVLEAVGHVPTWDDPQLVAGLIREFVARHGGFAGRAPATAQA